MANVFECALCVWAFESLAAAVDVVNQWIKMDSCQGEQLFAVNCLSIVQQSLPLVDKITLLLLADPQTHLPPTI